MPAHCRAAHKAPPEQAGLGKGGEGVEKPEAKKILSEQLQLLAERSKQTECTTKELCDLTAAMVALLQASWEII